MTLSTELITGIIAGATGLVTAIGSWLAARHQYKQNESKGKIDEMQAFHKANADFRDEVRRDLDKANARIATLEALIVSKDRLIIELQSELMVLRKELDAVKDKQ